MGKTVAIYRGYTAQNLKDRAECPTAGNITVNANDINCSNISLSQVKGILGASTYSLYDLCRHNNVNKWSGFSPYIKAISNAGMNGEITWTKPTVCKLGDFAGYNHGAITPSYYNSNRTTTESIASGASVTFYCDFYLGELILTDLNNALGIAFTVWEGSTLKGSHVRALSSLKDNCLPGDSTGFSVSFTGPSGSGGYYVDYTCKLFLISSATTYSYNSNEIAKLFHNELPQYTKRVRIQTPSSDVYHNTPYTPSFVSGGWEITTGHINCMALTLNHTYATGLKVDAWVEQYDLATNSWTRISSIINMRDPSRNTPYTSGEPIVEYYNVHHWTYTNGTERTAPVPSYDYRLYINYDGV